MVVLEPIERWMNRGAPPGNARDRGLYLQLFHSEPSPHAALLSISNSKLGSTFQLWSGDS